MSTPTITARQKQSVPKLLPHRRGGVSMLYYSPTGQLIEARAKSKAAFARGEYLFVSEV